MLKHGGGGELESWNGYLVVSHQVDKSGEWKKKGEIKKGYIWRYKFIYSKCNKMDAIQKRHLYFSFGCYCKSI